MVNFVTSIQSASNPPHLFSVSYGDTETNFGTSAVERLNIEYAKIAASGITMFFASGDNGAGGECTFDGPFLPSFPPSSPYVIAVGGVKGGDANSDPLGESVWLYGGGGFSNIFSTQSWQSDMVNSYFENASNLPNSDKYNASGRGYPDISAQSVNFEVVYDKDTTFAIDGTSASTPTVAGIFALLNDLRLQNNMSPLGYINPFIYQLATNDSTAFNDVTQGFNEGCTAVQEGFYAQSGWDPASGLGSPNYQVLKTYVLKSGEKTKKYAKTMNWKTRQRIG